MLPLSLCDVLRAVPGTVLALRETPSAMKHGLIVSPRYRASIREATAIVLDVSAGADAAMGKVVKHLDRGLAKGDRIMTAAGAGRPIYLGYTSSEEIELSVLHPLEIVAVLFDEQPAENQGQSPFRNIEGRDQFAEPERVKFDQGELHAPR